MDANQNLQDGCAGVLIAVLFYLAAYLILGLLLNLWWVLGGLFAFGFLWLCAACWAYAIAKFARRLKTD